MTMASIRTEVATILYMMVGSVAIKTVGPEYRLPTGCATAARHYQDIWSTSILLEADYIVVGAGTAGCVLATRLVERGNAVLLLEAGSDATSLQLRVPGLVTSLMGNPRFDWCHRSAPDASRHGKPVQWSAGKVVGGSSAINGMVFNRGLARDYDAWASAGCSGWSAAELLPYFERMESCVARDTHGPQPVEFNRYEFSAIGALLAACSATGIPVVDDINAFPLHGVGRTQTTTHRGVRYSTREAFLRRARHSDRLQLLPNAPVQRLRFDGTRCVGVNFNRDGIELQASARREVIVTAGAIATPKLLMLSGLGPAAELRALGITVLADRPCVGTNLQDHTGVAVSVATRVAGITARDRVGLRMVGHGLRWLLFGTGPAAGGAVLASAFACSGAAQRAPDLQLQFTALSLQRTAAGNPGLGQHCAITTICNVCQPRTRGSLHLSSASPDAPIDGRMQLLNDAEDNTRLVAGLKLIRRIHAEPALANVISREQLPGAEVQSDAALLEYCRERSASQYHPVGTCRMGSDADAVVDTALRVRGVTALRVADASIMPTLTSGNTNAPVMMIAEKAADLIGYQDRQ
jgi:choline dehydrogenase